MDREGMVSSLAIQSDGSILINLDTLPRSGQEIQVMNPTHVTSGTAEIQSVIEFDGGRADYPIGFVKFQPTSAILVFMGAPLPNLELIVRPRGHHRDCSGWIRPRKAVEEIINITLN